MNRQEVESLQPGDRVFWRTDAGNGSRFLTITKISVGRYGSTAFITAELPMPAGLSVVEGCEGLDLAVEAEFDDLSSTEKFDAMSQKDLDMAIHLAFDEAKQALIAEGRDAQIRWLLEVGWDAS